MSKHIKDFLPLLLGQSKDWKVTLIKEWPSIIGTLRDKVILEKIDHDAVVLGVFHPAWIQELSFLKPVILEAINSQLERPHIKTIHIKTCSPQKKYIPKGAPVVYKTPKAHVLTAREERALENIKDHELKEAMKLFLQRCVNSK